MSRLWRSIFFLALLSCGGQTSFEANLSGIDIEELSGKLMTETFAPSNLASNKLDVLLIIDGSESMNEQRAEIARKLQPLLNNIKARDWRIGITSTDDNSCFKTIIDAKTPDYANVYLEAIDSVRESNAEMAIKMAIRGLRGMPIEANNTCDANQPQYLVRKDSAIGILIITDEDHQCGSHDAEGCSIQDLYDFLRLIRVPGKNAKVYGFLNEEKNEKFLRWRDDGGETIFTRHESYKTTNYDGILKSISSDLGNIVQYKYTLKERHDDEASEVSITFGNNQSRLLAENEYGIVGRKLLILTNIPADTSKVLVNYSYQP